MVMPLDRLKPPLFCKWFYHCLCLKFCFDKYFFCCVFKLTILKPVRLSNYKLMEHGQILIRRLSARFDFLLPSYYGVNQCLSTRLGFQLQVVSTRSSYHPETISPVWFDYESPVLYVVKPVFITTWYAFIINRHNMEGVLSTQNLGYYPYYKKLVNQRCDSMSQV